MDKPEIVTRVQWGAREPDYRVAIHGSNGIFIHHSAGPRVKRPNVREQVRGIQRFHMDDRGWSDIAYNFLVADDGRIFEGRGWGVVGAATYNWNSHSHSFCYLGMGDEPITYAARDAFRWLKAEHKRRYGRSYCKGHRDVRATACPGPWLYNWAVKNRMAA